ncbi:MAG: helicase-associated domain-containing protein [Nocardioidaceae bacterium]
MPASKSPGSLADTIRGWDDTALLALLQARPDLASPLPSDTTQLVSRAGTRASLTRALDRLDRFALSAIEALAALTDPATAAEVGRLVQAPTAVADDVLQRLCGLALVWRDGTRWRLVRAVGEVLGPHPAGLGPWSRDPRLSDPTALATAVEAVDDNGRQVLDRLTWGPPTGHFGVETAAGSTIERLVAGGLLQSPDPRTVVLPREVGLHLRDGRLTAEPVHEPPPLTSTDRSTALVDRTAAGAAFDLVRRVELLLDSWAVDPPGVLRGGGVGVRDLRATARLLGVDEASAALHVELAREAGLLDTDDDRELDEVWAPTDTFDGWLARPAADRWLVLAGGWLSTLRTHGLVGRRDDRDRLVNALAPDLERTLTPEVRRLTLEVLAQAGPGAAPAVEDVVARVSWQRPRRAVLRDRVVGWTLDEAAIVGLTGLGALAAHGRALITGDDAARSLSPLLPDTVDHVLLQADLTAVAPGPLDTDLSSDLALAAEVESRGGATVYRFTEGSLRRALDAGWSAGDLHAFLATRSRTPVPQPLSYLVDDVARRHGHLRVGVAESYLRCDDPATLAAVLADPRSATLRLRRVGDTVLVSSLPVDVVLSGLREWGHSPAAEAPDGSLAGVRVTRRRVRSARRPGRRAHEVVRPDPTDLDRAVAALRAGDVAADARPPAAAMGGRAEPTRVLADLRTAAESGASVWLRYVDQHGSLTERVVDPIRVDGGWLTAHDHRADSTRTFAVHRISAVSTVAARR